MVQAARAGLVPCGLVRRSPGLQNHCGSFTALRSVLDDKVWVGASGGTGWNALAGTPPGLSVPDWPKSFANRVEILGAAPSDRLIGALVRLNAAALTIRGDRFV